MHFERDDLDLVLQKIDLVNAGGGQTKNKVGETEKVKSLLCNYSPFLKALSKKLNNFLLDPNSKFGFPFLFLAKIINLGSRESFEWDT